ncbi:antitoxin Xre/MbcA/ParS toxin-binding domain-containing protein [Candidatus Ruminimicrobiellum ovillum]|uniref:antitoxin Xre/MbcA/ParS toxin-binding domain-containing protein n=1 Tax=Candidatus Ruminimicrobiellum ovillum TaxID=1947927 RepID=UPI00355AB1F6
MQETKSNNQNETNLIDILVKEYKDETWEKIANSIKKTKLKIEGIPQDIIDVLVFTLDSEIEASEWLKRNLTAFDGKTAKDLLSTEKGTKALKQFILRIPM